MNHNQRRYIKKAGFIAKQFLILHHKNAIVHTLLHVPHFVAKGTVIIPHPPH